MSAEAPRPAAPPARADETCVGDEVCVIAVDAMGGDRAPAEIVAGALLAAAEPGIGVLLVGSPEAIQEHLPGGEPPDRVEVLAASDTIRMGEEPVAAVRARKDASVVRAAAAVRDGRARAMVGAGNTGATMASALFKLGRLPGIDRPAIAVPIPVFGGPPQLLVDGGASVDCQPEWLLQFARMGMAYARVRLGVESPSIGLLSNGEEAGKGDDLRKKTLPLLVDIPGFVGNVEGREVMTGWPNIVVTDGFTGNVVLKTLEGALKTMHRVIAEVLDSSPEAREAAALIGPAFLDAATKLDPDEYGGALLMGVGGVCVISHGSSSARAIRNAVLMAADYVRRDVVGLMREAVSGAG